MPKSDLQILTEFSTYAKENRHLGPEWAIFATSISDGGKKCLLITLDNLLSSTGYYINGKNSDTFFDAHDIRFQYDQLGDAAYYDDFLTRLDRAIARLKETAAPAPLVEEPSEELALVS